MAMARSDRRASSSIASSSSADFPPLTTSSSTSNIPPPRDNLYDAHDAHAARNHKRSRSQSQSHHHANATSSSGSRSPPPVRPSILQPRVAVVLNVNPQWHPYLFAFRLLSIAPALWWGLPCALQLVLSILPGPERVLVVRGPRDEDGRPHTSDDDDALPFALTEGALATIWVRPSVPLPPPNWIWIAHSILMATNSSKQSFACGYLAFFFTDCLMSRWLIHYTPQATIVRLLTINAVNAYLTMTVLSLAGGFEDPRLMLPGWIGMATTLTVSYHITHQKINIRKETSTSINVFSIASYISMVTLLVHMHSFQQNYPAIPLVGRTRKLWTDTYTTLAQIKRSIERAEL